MATLNPFDLLEDDAEDPSLVIAAQQLKKVAATAAPVVSKKGAATKAPVAAAAAKLPSKPLPPTQAGK